MRVHLQYKSLKGELMTKEDLTEEARNVYEMFVATKDFEGLFQWAVLIGELKAKRGLNLELREALSKQE